MEAMTAVSIAALAIYDMCKAVDRSIVIGPVRLLAKSGGRSGEWKRAGSREAARAAGPAGGRKAGQTRRVKPGATARIRTKAGRRG